MILKEKEIKKLVQYPRPDLRRNFQSLNGPWHLKLLKSEKKAKRFIKKFKKKIPLVTQNWETITVPYCIESEASGINKRISSTHGIYLKKL